MNKIARLLCVAGICAQLPACGNPNQRLDEYIFYDGPQFTLKVVRYYRNIPFNQLGLQAVVMCGSENTRDFPAYEQQDAGWRMLGSMDAKDSRNAKEAARGIKGDYDVFNDHILIGKTNAFNISFDACGHFINWNPGRLPQAMINAVEKPDSCAPDGPVDCRYYDFEGDRAPHYEDIHVTDSGQVSFTASSPAFKGMKLLHIQTRNNGALWHVETVALDKPDCREAQENAPDCTDRLRVDPDSVRSLPMSLLENGVTNINLSDWLESVLPNGSMVIWPDVLNDCGDRQCAEIRFNDSRGNNGTLYIAMQPGSRERPEETAFHSGIYKEGSRSLTIKSLGELRERLTGDNDKKTMQGNSA